MNGLPVSHRFFQDCQRENWARFIQWSVAKNQSLFCTMTFKDYIPERRSWKLIKHWLYNMSEAHREKMDLNKGDYRLRWIFATEWQVRMVIHYHGVVMGYGVDTLSRKRWEARWETLDRNTGFCRIFPADMKAAPYLAKYVGKSLFGDDKSQGNIYVGGVWQGWKVPASVSCTHSNSLTLGRVLSESSMHMMGR